MTSTTDLHLAILSMDAYNQGYSPGVTHGETQIGSATAIPLDEVGISPEQYQAWQAAGFYAVAYEWNGKTVISYRGTDVFNNADIENVGASDIMNGWLAAITPDGTEQTRLALEFYESVTDRDWKDGPAENVIS